MFFEVLTVGFVSGSNVYSIEKFLITSLVNLLKSQEIVESISKIVSIGSLFPAR